MRNYKILNRPMFNPNVSAYGRGIASNLVSEEQRQRFNYGGRVRAWNGLNIEPETGSYDIQDTILDIPDTTPKKKWWQPTEEYIDPNRDPRFYEDIIEPYPPITIKEKAVEEHIEEQEKKQEKARREEVGSLEDYLIEDDAEAPLKIVKKKKQEQTVMPDSDQLYTPEEQKEKKSQMMLAMAERLVGGSRDKWGSKAQMENISGAIGDIRKIADPSERRDMLAKYKAWGKARTTETLASLREQKKITKELAADKTMRFDEARDAGRTEQDALNTVYDANITIVSTSQKKDKKKIVENPSAYEGRIIFDNEERVYRISDGKKWDIITVNEIKELGS